MEIQIWPAHVGNIFVIIVIQTQQTHKSPFSMWTILLKVISYLSIVSYLVLSSA